MTVSGVSNSLPSSGQELQGLFTKPKQDLQSLQKDLSSGDLAGAQKDFTDFQTDISSLLNPPPSAPQGLQQATADFQALQSDLGSSNLQDAQKDFASLLQDLQGAAGQHKHHHHHHPDANKTDGNSSTSDPSSAGTSTGTSGNGLDFRAVMAAYAAFSNTATTGTSLNATA